LLSVLNATLTFRSDWIQIIIIRSFAIDDSINHG
jgi:hypothetical protein